MKKARRIASAAAAFIMAVSMTAAATTFAAFADDPVNVNISNNASTASSYKIYQILTGEISNGKLTNAAIGSDISEADLNAILDSTDLAGAVTALGEIEAEADKIALAKSIAAKVTGGKSLVPGTPTDVGSTGYYLIVSDDTNAQNNIAEAKTLNLLKIVGSTEVEINAKESAPTIEKKVGEEKAYLDETYGSKDIGGVTYNYNDVADSSIGETIPFKIYSTLPSGLSDYEHYVYTITDTYDDGITADADSIVVKIVRGDTEYTVYTSDSSDEAAEHGLTVDTSTPWQITVSFEDIMVYGVESTDKITVEYTGTLNENADRVSSEEENEKGRVKLTYSSNPNEDGWGEIEKPTNPDNPGETVEPTPDNPGTPSNTRPNNPETDDTPEDQVLVYTYALKLLKTDGSAAITGDTAARFTVYDNTLVKYVIPGDNNKAVYTEDAAEAQIALNEDGTITILGLDDGDYTITEVTAPSGYKGLDSPFDVTLTGGIITTQTWDGQDITAITIDNIAVTGDASDDITYGKDDAEIPQVTIENTPNGALPETGGIGTKLFYGIGGAAVLVSGVLLVTKRRMNKEQK